MSIQALLNDLERFGTENDTRPGIERSDKMLNIGRAVGELLRVLVGSTKPRRILELGTSNGYSTLWLALAARQVGGGARVFTAEISARKFTLAKANFEKSGLGPYIESRQAEGGDFLREQPDASAGFIFLDADRSHYVPWWPELRRVLAPGGLLVVDNVISHADEVAEFRRLVTADSGAFITSLVPIGKGQWLVLKPHAPAAVTA
ncbi:MAG: class I SAM-dependent methyltransferase [Verrucomicrobia bacterium]|nr:class I SAM-dependent methyltransferase [Verrucomicrobiota bacterium]